MWIAITGLAGLAGGCTDPVEDLPPAKVETVSAYGVTLDESASPAQVAFVLLRSLAEDVRAAQAHRGDDQKAAHRISWSVAAPNAIEQRILETYRKTAKDPSKYTSLGQDREKEIHRIVNLWAPIVAYYVGSFDSEPAAAMARMEVRPGPAMTQVLYEVWPQPPGPLEEFNHRQTLSIELAREKGGDGKEYWRVAHLRFLPRAPRAATQPATSPRQGD